MPVEVLSFDEAVNNARAGDKPGKVHLLLGNGFSIACRPERFTYGALLDMADFTEANSDLRHIFEILRTSDFERVIEFLRAFAAIAEHYGAEAGFCALLSADADVVKDALARALAATHPDLPTELGDDEYFAVRTFLSHFDCIYTLNYDMLLYWSLMRWELGTVVPMHDGFRSPDDDTADYVQWEAYKDYRNQRVFYIHGGLHLYDRGAEITKITWSRTGVPLVDQIRDALGEGRYPLIVTEGRSEEKEARIIHNPYLNHALRSFAQIGGSLFVFGHSLAPNDEHVLRRIEEGRVARLFVGLHGDPSSELNTKMIHRASAMAETRDHKRPLEVSFFDTATAHAWA